MKKILLLSLLSLVSLSSLAQNKRILLQGFVKDSLGIVKNVNVFNMSSLQGTFTDDTGKYEIYAQVGDNLRFSSIQHTLLYQRVNDVDTDGKLTDIVLELNTVQLDEVVVSNTLLDGVLTSDRKKTPKNKRLLQLKKNMDLSKYNMNEVAPDDHISSRVKPPQKSVDPTAVFAGAGAGVTVAWKHSKKLWDLRKDLAYKANFPSLLKEELGVNFFRKELKIPDDQYYRFLEFCNPLGIENLYKTNQLKVIQILKKESKAYLALNSKEAIKNE